MPYSGIHPRMKFQRSRVTVIAESLHYRSHSNETQEGVGFIKAEDSGLISSIKLNNTLVRRVREWRGFQLIAHNYCLALLSPLDTPLGKRYEFHSIPYGILPFKKLDIASRIRVHWAKRGAFSKATVLERDSDASKLSSHSYTMVELSYSFYRVLQARRANPMFSRRGKPFFANAKGFPILMTSMPETK